jgi:SAM-dependent methyltransferase
MNSSLAPRLLIGPRAPDPSRHDPVAPTPRPSAPASSLRSDNLAPVGPGSIDYDRYAPSYPAQRRADARIAARINAALGRAKTVLNVGAGSGSYEPQDRVVLAVEPSWGMRAQRARHLPPAIAASAESLPLDENSVDAAMAILTVHHWSDPIAGLREMRRVARGPVVIVTFDVDVLAEFWMLTDYLPEALTDDRRRFVTIDAITEQLEGARVDAVPVPADCTDGFFEAHYGKPEAYLDPAVRAAQSVWPRLPPGVEQRAVTALSSDLASGAWDARHGHLRTQQEFEGGLRIIVAPGDPQRAGSLPATYGSRGLGAATFVVNNGCRSGSA